jgi:hypothetical protein
MTFIVVVVCVQTRVVAVDAGTPALSSTCVVTFNVNHNLRDPVFVGTPYTATVSECAAFDASVMSVSATDADYFVRLHFFKYVIMFAQIFVCVCVLCASGCVCVGTWMSVNVSVCIHV